MPKTQKKTASKPAPKDLAKDTYKGLYKAVSEANDILTQKVNETKKKFNQTSSGVDFSILKALEESQGLIKGILASFPDSV